MTFPAGQKVECISTEHVETPSLVLGRVYTVHFGCNRHYGSGVLLSEINPAPGKCCFLACLFRPVVESGADISFAHDILRKINGSVDA